MGGAGWVGTAEVSVITVPKDPTEQPSGDEWKCTDLPATPDGGPADRRESELASALFCPLK